MHFLAKIVFPSNVDRKHTKYVIFIFDLCLLQCCYCKNNILILGVIWVVAKKYSDSRSVTMAVVDYKTK